MFNNLHSLVNATVLLASLLAVPCLAGAEEYGADANLARELTNPVADLMTIPFQMNFDQDIGPADGGRRFLMNIQPVIPFHFNDDWNLITRTILPVIDQSDIFPGAGSQSGLGDLFLTTFFSPKPEGAGGLIWGVGPVFLLPTATDPLLGFEKWGTGGAAVALVQRGPWTYGGLVNHVWSFAGESDREDISNTLAQPFVSYTWPSAWTLSVVSESNYNWEASEWSVPVNVGLSKLVFFGPLPVNFQAGIGYWLESPDRGAEGVRFRFQATVVLPRP